MSQSIAEATQPFGGRSFDLFSGEEDACPFPLWIPILLLAHVPLGLIMKEMPLVSTLHALITFAVGLFFIIHDSRPYRLIYLAAYITGAELLWRGTHANILWEFGKYSISFLLLLALLKQQRLGDADRRPGLYFLLLLPSISVMPEFERNMISFNLSGPLALAIATMFFSTVRFTGSHIRRVLLAILFPIVSLAILAVTTTLSTEDLTFGGSSNFATSGNIGPNQVSSMLGLGALAAILYALGENKHRLVKILMIVCALWLSAQAALTFSRGGLLGAFGALIGAIVYMLRDRSTRPTILMLGGIVFLLGYFFVFPVLNQFTGGALANRYEQSGATGRDLIVQADLMAFSENPVFGVGPHQSKAYHEILFRWSSTHTEFSRLLAEHGLFGLAALLILVRITWQRIRSNRSPLEKGYVICFTSWALLFMLHAAMRLAAPSFMFGLAASTILFETDVIEGLKTHLDLNGDAYLSRL